MQKRDRSNRRRTVVRLFLRLLWLLPLALTAAGFLILNLIGPEPLHTAPALVAREHRADTILIEKTARRMTLYRKGEVISRHKVRLGFSPTGPKQQEGDGKTPEGTYRIDRRNAHSRFYLSLGINYPLPAQRQSARNRGVSPGGDIFIHGQPNRLRGLGLSLPFDWTDGCIAVSNAEMEAIYSLVPIGTKVTIRP